MLKIINEIKSIYYNDITIDDYVLFFYSKIYIWIIENCIYLLYYFFKFMIYNCFDITILFYIKIKMMNRILKFHKLKIDEYFLCPYSEKKIENSNIK